MFEFTIIEHSSNDDHVIAHFAFSNEEFDTEAKKLIDQEEKCLRSGILKAYSTLTHYIPDWQTFTRQRAMTVEREE